jgi:hypothetical protein
VPFKNDRRWNSTSAPFAGHAVKGVWIETFRGFASGNAVVGGDERQRDKIGDFSHGLTPTA